MALALTANGVIINADSLQLYNALPILTAQPSDADKRAAPHRLYGVLPPQAACSAAQWRELAITEIDGAHDTGKLPILVGGTGLYLNALLKGLSPMPDVPPEIRAAAIARQTKLGNPAFHADLASCDPAMAARLHPNDTQRLIRAWEVFAATGRSLAAWQAATPAAAPSDYQFTVEIIDLPRAELYDRCNRRFDAMLTQGALEEATAMNQRMAAGDIDWNAPVANALGFKQLLALKHGALSRSQAIDRAKAQTRQYAKRQVTWFRHQLPKHLTSVNHIGDIIGE